MSIEIEYIFPFNKKKWSMFLEPTFYYYRNEKDFIVYNSSSSPSNPETAGGGRGNLTVKYSHIAFPLGLRNSFYLNTKSKLFLNGGLGYNIILSPSKALIIDNPNITPNFSQKSVNTTPSFITGLGYKYKNMASVEARYHFGKTMLDTKDWKSRQTNSLLLILGYKIP
jgi:hypothetical protein